MDLGPEGPAGASQAWEDVGEGVTLWAMGTAEGLNAGSVKEDGMPGS